MKNTKISCKPLILTLMSLIFAFFVSPVIGIFAAPEEEQTGVYYGDVDDSGVVDAKDVTALRRYLAGGWNITINTEKADVDGNGQVEAKDVTMLRRYLAGGWGVELPEKKESSTSKAYKSRNLNMNMYDGNWYHPIYSYLYEENGYIYRAERDSDGEGKLYIEKYDTDWRLLGTTIVEYGYEYIWGGLFIGEQYNFIVVGQTNNEEKNDKLVFKIIKYDKSWTEIGNLDIYGANTVTPFSGGTLRCAESEGYLYITTCHTMYAYTDGLNHQANVLIVIDENEMKKVDQITAVLRTEEGSVSHSFNQFIEATSDGSIYRLDQGDANPRALVLSKVWKSRCLLLQKFKEAVSSSMYCVNITGAEIAGIKESGDGLAVAYIYDDRGGQEEAAPNYIYIMNVPKALIDKTSKPPILGLKLYNIYGDSYLYKSPLIVSLGPDKGGVILWNELEKITVGNEEYVYKKNDRICFVKYYPNGSVSDVYSFEGSLSDCEPIEVNGKIIWYVTDGGVPEFYELDLDKLVTYRYYADGNSFETLQAETRTDFKISAVAETPADIIEKTEYESAVNLEQFGLSIDTEPDEYYDNGNIKRKKTVTVYPSGSYIVIEEYYSNGNMKKQISYSDVISNININEFNNSGERSRYISYNAQGGYNLTTYKDGLVIEKYQKYASGIWKCEKNEYYNDGKLLKKVKTESDGSWETKEYKYGDKGEVIYEIDRSYLGSWLSTETEYDENGKKCSEYILNNVGQYSEKEFNANGKCIKEHKLNSAGEYLILTEYDDNNHRTKEIVKTDNIEQESIYKYVVIKKGYSTRSQEQLVSQMNKYLDDESWIKYEYTYDDDFRMIAKRTTDSDGYESNMNRTYDEEGRLILETQTDPTGTSTGEYTYDENGKGRCVWTNPDGTVEIYESDEYGEFRLVKA